MSYNKSIMTDAEDNFYKTYEQDGLGRISKVTIGLQRREMLSYSLTYDSVGHIKTKSSKNHEGRPSEENYSYTKSRQLAKIWGPDNFDYEHDENGNLIKVQGAQGKTYLCLTLFHLSSGMTLLPEGGPLWPGQILGFLK